MQLLFIIYLFVLKNIYYFKEGVLGKKTFSIINSHNFRSQITISSSEKNIEINAGK